MSNTFSGTDTVVQTQLMLEKIKISMSSAVGASVLHDLRLSIHEPSFLDGMIVELATDLLTQRLCEDEYTVTDMKIVHIPKGPWQHFKLKYFPRWLKDRRPVQYDSKQVHFSKTIKIDRRETYPMSSLATQSNPEFIRLMGAPVVRDIVEEATP